MPADLGFRSTLKTTFEEAIERTTAALKAEGFGVLTRIDVHSTFKEKLNLEFRKYAILGACNPPLAHRALSADPDVGLLLPCNVTVQEQDDAIIVTAVDPVQMLGALQGQPAVSAVAVEAAGKLKKVISALR